MSIEALRSAPAAAQVGCTNAVGVPSLLERVADRPGLRLAIVQVAYAVQGRPEMTFVDDVWSFGGVTRWIETTTRAVEVPTSFVMASAVHATKELEASLVAQGFDVIPHETVAATDAYAKHYGDYPPGYSMENSGFAVVGAHPMKVKQATSLMGFGQLHLLWPDDEVLSDIEAELGEDLLLLTVRYQISTLRRHSGNLVVSGMVTVNDPDFAGHGIGGYGTW